MKRVNRQAFRERLLEAISRKTGKPAGKGWTIFARDSGIAVSVFQSYMDAHDPSEPRADNLLRIARTAGVTPEWLLYGTTTDRVAPLDLSKKGAPARLSDQIPVYPFDGTALACGKDDRPAGKPTQYVVRALDNTDPKAYALRIAGRTLVPRFWPDDVIEVRMDVPPRSGQIAVIQARDGRTWIRIVDLRARAGRIVAVPWTPMDEPVELSEVDVRFLHRVGTVRCRGMY